MEYEFIRNERKKPHKPPYWFRVAKQFHATYDLLELPRTESMPNISNRSGLEVYVSVPDEVSLEQLSPLMAILDYIPKQSSEE